MVDNERKEFTKILIMVAELFDKDLSENLINLYFHALKDLDISKIKTASSNLIKSATFFPKPVDFRNAIIGNVDDKSIEAWTKALNAKNKYNSVKFDDPAIHSAIEAMGGWIKFCTMEDYKEESWQMKDFTKIYKSVAGRGGHIEYLSGMSELENGARGHSDFIPKIIQVGSIEKVEGLE